MHVHFLTESLPSIRLDCTIAAISFFVFVFKLGFRDPDPLTFKSC